MLGANLSLYRLESTELSMKSLIFTSAFRMIIYPLIGIAIVFGSKLGGLIIDPMMEFVLLLMYATPPANQLLVMAQIHKNLEADFSKALLITYLASILTLTMYTALFLYLITW